MIQDVAFDSFDTVVRDICAFDGDSQADNYLRTSRILARCLEEINEYAIPNIESKVFEIEDNLTVILPIDVQSVIKVGALTANGAVRIMGENQGLIAPSQKPLKCTCSSSSSNGINIASYRFDNLLTGSILEIRFTNGTVMELPNYPYAFSPSNINPLLTSDIKLYYENGGHELLDVTISGVIGGGSVGLLFSKSSLAVSEIKYTPVSAAPQTVAPFIFGEDIFYPGENCEDDIISQPINNNAPCYYCTFHNICIAGNSGYRPAYGLHPKSYRNGTYKYDIKRNLIILGNGYDVKVGNEILVEYRTGMTNEKYLLIPRLAFQLLYHRVMYFASVNSNTNLAMSHLSQYRVEWKRFKARQLDVALEDILAVIRRNYRRGVKG